MKSAVVLLSGGVDSATTLAIARNQGFLPYALSFAYGQRHSRELESATRVAAALGAKEHRILTLDLRLIGGSALTGEIAVPKGRSLEEIGSGIPVTYVPARNTIFLAHALGWAEVLGAEDVFFPSQRPRLLRVPRLPSRVHRGLRADGEPGHEGRGGGQEPVQDSHTPDPDDQGRDCPGRPCPGRGFLAHVVLLRAESRRSSLRTLR